MFNRQHKTVTSSTIQGSSSSSSSSSTVTRTFITSSTTFHSQSSSSQFEIPKNTESSAVLDTIKRLEQLSIKQQPNKITPRKDDNFPLKKAVISVPSSTVSSSSSSPKSNDKFQLDCLKAHNEYRRKHGVGPLKLNPTLSDFAQNWANTIANKRQLQHSSEKKYGENIYWSSGQTVDGKMPVDSWYNEIKQYSYKNASFSAGTGHFTQVVWKNSSDLGVGMACVGNEVFVVASYYPPGNYAGEFSKNVLPPT